MVRPSRPARGRPGSHLSRRAPALTFIAPRGFETSPPTRARVRLLGPCFKTGRVGCRHRRRPLAPFTWADPRPGDATRSGRTEDSPPRSKTAAPGTGGPVPPNPAAPPRESGRGREGAASTRSTAPGSGEVRAKRRCKARGRSREPPSPPSLSWPTRSRSRRTASGGNAPGGGRPAPGGGPSRGSPRAVRPSLTRRVESPGRTARTPPVYLSTVSRPLELSLQSSFQLSLKVLVDYRSRAGI